MTLRVSHTTIDSHDAYALAQWWKQALGYADMPGDPDEPGDEECMIHDPETGHALLFIEVGADKTTKNRVHLDLASRDATRDEEVEVLLSTGAVEVADHRGKYGPGTGWVTLADPEGNEFCVVRSQAEQAATNT